MDVRRRRELVLDQRLGSALGDRNLLTRQFAQQQGVGGGRLDGDVAEGGSHAEEFDVRMRQTDGNRLGIIHARIGIKDNRCFHADLVKEVTCNRGRYANRAPMR